MASCRADLLIGVYILDGINDNAFHFRSDLAVFGGVLDDHAYRLGEGVDDHHNDQDGEDIGQDGDPG